jgi:hypothetical protein
LLGTIGSMTMGVADFPIEIFRVARTKKEAHIARKATMSTKDGSSHSKPSKTTSRSQSQLDLASQETAGTAGPISPRVSTSILSPKTSHESTERSSSDTAATTDTSLTSISSHERAIRGNSLKEALRGTLSRSRSQSRDRASKFGRSFSRDRSSTSRTNSPSRQPKEFDPSALTLDNAVGAGKGIARIVGAGLKSPMDFTLGIARGFHNAPKLYGDDTVRPQAKVTDFQSGVKAATKVCLSQCPLISERF